ncbi:MAG TPA: PilW family protein [Gammaproteobacteria bacterium]
MTAMTFNSIRRQRGMTLVEVLIASTIGVFLIGGAMSVFITASNSRHVNDDVARMQENARYAMSTIKPDLRLAGYWGLTAVVGLLNGHKGSITPIPAAQAPANDCAASWFIDLANEVEASNDVNPYAATCLPATEYLAGTDVLVVRHADPDPAPALVPGQIYIRADANNGVVFEGSAPPAAGFSAFAQDHRLVTHAYYIRPYAFAEGDNIPSLYRLSLGNAGGATVITDEEVIPGIEDLQVQFGIDTNGDGSINQYVNADSAAIAGAEILATRIWIMARTLNPEFGFTDNATYTYASKSVTPADNFRRLLMSSTIQLRNIQVNAP